MEASSGDHPFLEGPLLAADQSESYFEPRVSDQRGTLFEHCARALDRSLAVGHHGLPPDGHGGLERRDEPGGFRRHGRERLARLVPSRDSP